MLRPLHEVLFDMVIESLRILKGEYEVLHDDYEKRLIQRERHSHDEIERLAKRERELMELLAARPRVYPADTPGDSNYEVFDLMIKIYVKEYARGPFWERDFPKIKLIKWVRASTGCGLLEAKQLVETAMKEAIH